VGRLNKRTKALQFPKATALKIVERDEMCIFCKLYYHMDSTSTLAYQIQQIMHIVNKSQGGLGIEENGVLGCQYHHGLLDNGNLGLRDEMIEILEEHLKNLYPGWTEDSVKFDKWKEIK
jgi:predicted restriction endonuclease